MRGDFKTIAGLLTKEQKDLYDVYDEYLETKTKEKLAKYLNMDIENVDLNKIPLPLSFYNFSEEVVSLDHQRGNAKKRIKLIARFLKGEIEKYDDMTTEEKKIVEKEVFDEWIKKKLTPSRKPEMAEATVTPIDDKKTEEKIIEPQSVEQEINPIIKLQQVQTENLEEAPESISKSQPIISESISINPFFNVLQTISGDQQEKGLPADVPIETGSTKETHKEEANKLPVPISASTPVKIVNKIENNQIICENGKTLNVGDYISGFTTDNVVYQITEINQESNNITIKNCINNTIYNLNLEAICNKEGLQKIEPSEAQKIISNELTKHSINKRHIMPQQSQYIGTPKSEPISGKDIPNLSLSPTIEQETKQQTREDKENISITPIEHTHRIEDNVIKCGDGRQFNVGDFFKNKKGTIYKILKIDGMNNYIQAIRLTDNKNIKTKLLDICDPNIIALDSTEKEAIIAKQKADAEEEARIAEARIAEARLAEEARISKQMEEEKETVAIKFVFDFDCTLTQEHFYWFINSNNKMTKTYDENDRKNLKNYIFNIGTPTSETTDRMKIFFFGDNERQTALINMFEAIGKGNLYILSNGIRDHIIKLLTLFDLIKYFNEDNIYGLSASKMTKDYYLDLFIKEGNIVYIDDDNKEHDRYITSNIPRNMNYMGDVILPTSNYKLNIYKQNAPLENFYIYGNLPKERSGLTTDTIIELVSGSKNIINGKQQIIQSTTIPLSVTLSTTQQPILPPTIPPTIPPPIPPSTPKIMECTRNGVTKRVTVTREDKNKIYGKVGEEDVRYCKNKCNQVQDGGYNSIANDYNDLELAILYKLNQNNTNSPPLKNFVNKMGINWKVIKKLSNNISKETLQEIAKLVNYDNNSTIFGGKERAKYLKYKIKYLELKKNNSN